MIRRETEVPIEYFPVGSLLPYQSFINNTLLGRRGPTGLATPRCRSHYSGSATIVAEPLSYQTVARSVPSLCVIEYPADTRERGRGPTGTAYKDTT